jgi:DNA primase
MADPIIQEIKSRIDIAEVIGEYIPLKRAGVTLKANCPFHSEKSPSFTVNRERGIWHCFGCGEGGDVFAFIQKHEGLSFPEVLKILANRAGVILPEKRDMTQATKETAIREELLAVNQLAADFYHQALLKSQSGAIARDYVAHRGLNADTITQWKIGFAPDSFHHLLDFLRQRGVTDRVAIAAGLAASGDRGAYDRFRLRVMFPFLDQYGRVVGFTGRTLSDSGKEAKYINSPETPIYHKGSFLFGFYVAKQAIRKNDLAVVVEGNLDCISSYQAGVQHVVASSGTALTLDQLNLLKRVTSNVVFALDGDQAGQTATRRAMELALSAGFTVRVADLGEAKDPDELIAQDPKLWQKAVTTAPSFLDHSFNSAFANIPASNLELLRKAAQQHLEVVSLASDSIIQAQEARRVAEKLSVPVDAILTALKKKPAAAASPGNSHNKPEQKKPARRPKTRREMLEERIVGIGMVNPRLRAVRDTILSDADFITIPAHFIVSGPPSGEQSDEEVYSRSLLEFIGQEELARLGQEYEDEDRLEASYTQLCRELKTLAIKEKMKELSIQIAQSEKSGDIAQAMNLKNQLGRFVELSDQYGESQK